ncbi:DNA-binding protein [Altererythrobacter sp. BO-6]|nr:DNA-binding protein [Altererythrobacter sp. BO-6]
MSAHTLAKWRVQGCGPKFVKAGRCVFYLEDDLDSFLSERRHTSTAEYLGRGLA